MTLFTLDIYAPEIYEMSVYKHTEIIEYVKNAAYFLRKIQTLWVNNSRIFWVKNANLQGIVFIWSRA